MLYTFPNVREAGCVAVVRSDTIRSMEMPVFRTMNKDVTYDLFVTPLADLPHRLAVPTATPGGKVLVGEDRYRALELFPFAANEKIGIKLVPDKGYRIKIAVLTGGTVVSNLPLSDSTTKVMLPAQDATLAVEFEETPNNSFTIRSEPAKGGTVSGYAAGAKFDYSSGASVFPVSDIPEGTSYTARAFPMTTLGYSFLKWTLNEVDVPTNGSTSNL